MCEKSDRKRERERERESKSAGVCVCERERKREKECVCEREGERWGRERESQSKDTEHDTLNRAVFAPYKIQGTKNNIFFTVSIEVKHIKRCIGYS